MPPGLRCVREGDEPSLLTIDFGTTRTEAGFVDLIPLIDGDMPVYECVPPGQRGTTTTAPAAEPYLSRWADAVRAEGMQVKAVLGYCAGGMLAAALADRLGQGSIPTVAFDAAPVTPSFVAMEFTDRLRTYWDAIEPAGRAEATETADIIRSSGPDELGPACVAAADLYARLTTPVLADFGVLPSIAQELQGQLSAWLCYLAAASQVDPTLLDASVSFVNSTEAHWTVPGGRPVTVPTARADLLRDPQTAAVVAEALGRSPSPADRKSAGAPSTQPR